jgi:hypothetical protein
MSYASHRKIHKNTWSNGVNFNSKKVENQKKDNSSKKEKTTNGN